MLKRIINFEINEIYPQLIMDYIADKKYKNSTLRKLFHKKLIKFYTTKALDVEESKLYPSQSWFHLILVNLMQCISVTGILTL